MNFDFADILLEVIETGASDLHLTAGSPPMVRIRGKLGPLDYPPLSPQDTREIVYSILNNEQRKRLETDWQIDLSYAVPNKSRFRVNAFRQRGSVAMMAPPCITAMRSLIPRISGSSDDIMMIASPCAARSTIIWWISDFREIQNSPS